MNYEIGRSERNMNIMICNMKMFSKVSCVAMSSDISTFCSVDRRDRPADEVQVGRTVFLVDVVHKEPRDGE